MFDEIDEKGEGAVEQYLGFQSVAQEAGFKTGSTFQFYSATKRERILRLNPATSCWMLQASWTLGFHEATNGLRDIESTDELLPYGWRWENYSYYRAHEEFWRVFYPLAAAPNRIGFYYAGLIRPARFSTVVEDPRGFVVARSMEAYRDALDAIKLYRGLLLARAGLPPEQRGKLDRELRKVVGMDADALVRFSRTTVDRGHRGYESKDIPVLSTAPDVGAMRYRQAKRQLLVLGEAYVVPGAPN